MIEFEPMTDLDRELWRSAFAHAAHGLLLAVTALACLWIAAGSTHSAEQTLRIYSHTPTAATAQEGHTAP